MGPPNKFGDFQGNREKRAKKDLSLSILNLDFNPRSFISCSMSLSALSQDKISNINSYESIYEPSIKIGFNWENLFFPIDSKRR